MVLIVDVVVHDIRFPTSEGMHGSDAMHPDPDYSAAYCVIKTDSALEGHGLTFTIGRGNEIVKAGIEALKVTTAADTRTPATTRRLLPVHAADAALPSSHPPLFVPLSSSSVPHRGQDAGEHHV